MHAVQHVKVEVHAEARPTRAAELPHSWAVLYFFGVAKIIVSTRKFWTDRMFAYEEERRSDNALCLLCLHEPVSA